MQFPVPVRRYWLAGSLSGVSGFVPIIGPGLAATGTILPAVGSFLRNAAASKSDPLVDQKEFAPKVRELYDSYVGALDQAGTTLFQGGTVQTAKGGFNITDMMAGGAWVNLRLRDLETNLTVEILSRSIDALWKTPPSNKMWVLFVDLDDDLESASKSLADRSGPQDSKYCPDGGIYYTYSFIEDGDKRGYVSYPWGVVTEASAKSYRLAKRKAIEPFNVTGAIGTETFLAEAVKDNGTKIALLNQAVRYPGSWKLPIYDASTWDQGWNWDYRSSDWDNDYTAGDFGTSPKHQTHPPYLCGEPQRMIGL
ncbi:MAG: hypothetical protein Q9199_006756 [Rusavskia elegans]